MRFIKGETQDFFTPNFRRVVPQLICFPKSCYYQGLAFYDFSNSSFLFFQVWNSYLLHGINYMFLKFQHGRAEN